MEKIVHIVDCTTISFVQFLLMNREVLDTKVKNVSVIAIVDSDQYASYVIKLVGKSKRSILSIVKSNSSNIVSDVAAQMHLLQGVCNVFLHTDNTAVFNAMVSNWTFTEYQMLIGIFDGGVVCALGGDVVVPPKNIVDLAAYKSMIKYCGQGVPKVLYFVDTENIQINGIVSHPLLQEHMLGNMGDSAMYLPINLSRGSVPENVINQRALKFLAESMNSVYVCEVWATGASALDFVISTMASVSAAKLSKPRTYVFVSNDKGFENTISTLMSLLPHHEYVQLTTNGIKI